MNEALFNPSSTACMFGSVTAPTACGLTGRPLSAAHVSWFSWFVMNFKKSTASGGASLPTAKPSAPPKASVGWPAPPSTVGNGNQPSSKGRFAAPSTPAWVANAPGAHWPIRSIAAPPLAIVPDSPSGASQPAPRNPAWNGSSATRSPTFSPASTTAGTLKLLSAAIWFIASAPPRRIMRYEYQKWAGHLSPAPTAIGVIPASFRVCTSASSSSQVSGGALIPACAKRSLLYQTPTMLALYGMPYCLPSTWYRLVAPSLRSPTKSDEASVMSCTKPASTWSRNPPPPHDWNRSGTSPDCRLVCRAALNASFSITVILILTFGLASM